MNPYYLTRDGEEIGVEATTRGGIELAARTLLAEGEDAPLTLHGPNGYTATASVEDTPVGPRVTLRGTWGA